MTQQSLKTISILVILLSLLTTTWKYNEAKVQSEMDISTVQQESATCPENCQCIWKKGKDTMTCVNITFSSITPGLKVNSGVQVIVLSASEITSLSAEIFWKSNLPNLQMITINNCQLEHVHPTAFKNLINLVKLNLESNLLISIPSESMRSLSQLMELSLAQNQKVTEITDNSFMSLSELIKLDLSYCKISHIHFNAFSGLVSLQRLKLHGNKLTTLSMSVFTNLASQTPIKLPLVEVSLHKNPWNCTCRLVPLLRWLESNNIVLPVDPSCTYSTISSTRFQVSWMQFTTHVEKSNTCPETYIKAVNIVKVEDEKKQNVIISCQFQAKPKPNIEWSWEESRENVNTTHENTEGSLNRVTNKVERLFKNVIHSIATTRVMPDGLFETNLTMVPTTSQSAFINNWNHAFARNNNIDDRTARVNKSYVYTCTAANKDTKSSMSIGIDSFPQQHEQKTLPKTFMNETDVIITKKGDREESASLLENREIAVRDGEQAGAAKIATLLKINFVQLMESPLLFLFGVGCFTVFVLTVVVIHTTTFVRRRMKIQQDHQNRQHFTHCLGGGRGSDGGFVPSNINCGDDESNSNMIVTNGIYVGRSPDGKRFSRYKPYIANLHDRCINHIEYMQMVDGQQHQEMKPPESSPSDQGTPSFGIHFDETPTSRPSFESTSIKIKPRVPKRRHVCAIEYDLACGNSSEHNDTCDNKSILTDGNRFRSVPRCRKDRRYSLGCSSRTSKTWDNHLQQIHGNPNEPDIREGKNGEKSDSGGRTSFSSRIIPHSNTTERIDLFGESTSDDKNEIFSDNWQTEFPRKDVMMLCNESEAGGTSNQTVRPTSLKLDCPIILDSTEGERGVTGNIDHPVPPEEFQDDTHTKSPLNLDITANLNIGNDGIIPLVNFSSTPSPVSCTTTIASSSRRVRFLEQH